MKIQNNSTTFKAHILPSEPLKKFFGSISQKSDILSKRRMINNIDALVNDGTQDVVEIKKVMESKGEQIRGFINGKDSKIGCIIDESRRISEADSAYEVIRRLAGKRNPVQKVQKFGLRKLKQLYECIFNTNSNQK